jgi:hypothetical protein
MFSWRYSPYVRVLFQASAVEIAVLITESRADSVH